VFRQFLTSIQLPSVGRSLRGVTVGLLLMMPIVAVVMRNEGEAQNSRLQQDVTETPTPTFDPFVLPSLTPTFDPFATQTFTPDPFAPTIDPFIPTTDPFATPDPFAQTPFNPEATLEPTPFPTATPVIEPETNLLLDAVRDMALLADSILGAGIRPEGWNGSQDPFNAELPVQTRSDVETLASELIGPTERPRDWIGAVGSTPFAIARDVRHDVERLADLVYGFGTRPEGWTGADPLMSCNRSTQTLVELLERGGIFILDVDANDPQFCRNAELAATQFTEEQILANTQGDLFADNIAILAENTVEGDLAIAFLDSAATGQVGIIPDGTPIQVLGKSNASFSRMMLVSGDNFQVYVDYQNTTVTEQQFRSLPNAASLDVTPGCFAEWCESN
jgi:hypothetical protein